MEPVWLLAAVAAIVVMAALWLWKRKREAPPASIVLLLREPKVLNAHALAEALGRETGREVTPILKDAAPGPADDQPVGEWVTGETPHFIAHVGGTMFMIHNIAAPYWDDPLRASEDVREMRLAQAVREHHAWLSMDILHPEQASAENYRIAARVLANLADANCLALYYPPENRLVPYVEETAAKLRSEDPVQAVFRELSALPVIAVDDDPRLRAAEEEARRRFGEFEQAFREGSGTDFSVKALIRVGENGEHIWIDVEWIEGDRIAGRLGNEPVALGELKLGSRVEIGCGEVEDWAFVRDGAPVGAFTPPVLMKIEEERR